MAARGPKDTVGPVEPDQPGPEGDVDPKPADAPDEDGNEGVPDQDGFVDPDEDASDHIAEAVSLVNDDAPLASPYEGDAANAAQDDFTDDEAEEPK